MALPSVKSTRQDKLNDLMSNEIIGSGVDVAASGSHPRPLLQVPLTFQANGRPSRVWREQQQLQQPHATVLTPPYRRQRPIPPPKINVTPSAYRTQESTRAQGKVRFREYVGLYFFYFSTH